MRVTIMPKSKRAHERIRVHGPVMTLVKQDQFKGEPAILVESLKPTASKGRKWLGWLTTTEADWEKANG